MNSYSYRLCEARDYGDCYLHNEEFDVTFKYRDAKGRHQPDEVVKVCMCKGHYNWLSKNNQGKPLVMRGEAPQYALHDDLFAPFINKAHIYTLLKVEFNEELTEKKEPKEDVQYHLFNGRDVDAMRKIIQTWYPTKDYYIRSYEEGFFQNTFQYKEDEDDGESSGYAEEVIIEVKPIKGELALEALANGLAHMNIMTPDGAKVAISPSVYTWIPRANTEPLYAPKPLPDLFRRFFKEKQAEEISVNFIECVEFIKGNINAEIIDWAQVRENSPHTDIRVFNMCLLLTEALLNKTEGDEIIHEMMEAGELTPDVLWITYVMTNHQLFSSCDKQKDLTKNKKLVELFLAQGLEKDLLALAISGERERFLSRKRRDHYNILYENEFVVEYLVPKYVAGDAIIYKTDHAELTALAYWGYYDNSTCYIAGGRMDADGFDKNEQIRLYLELHTTELVLVPTELVLVPTVEKEKVLAVDETFLFGQLDMNVCVQKSLVLL